MTYEINYPNTPSRVVGSPVSVPVRDPNRPLRTELNWVRSAFTWVVSDAPTVFRAVVAELSWLIRVVGILVPAAMTWLSWLLTVFSAVCTPLATVFSPLVRVVGRAVSPLLTMLFRVV